MHEIEIFNAEVKINHDQSEREYPEIGFLNFLTGLLKLFIK